MHGQVLEGQELPTFPELLNLPPVVVGFVSLDLLLYMNVFWIVVCPFVLFLLANVFSVLRFTDSDYPFGVFKLFLQKQDNSTVDPNCRMKCSADLRLHIHCVP
jgi:hypothetical protein